MDELPDEIMPTIAGYLPPVDTIQLNSTSKILHSKPSITASYPREILTKFSRRDCDGDLHYGFQVPVPHQVSCHSVLLSLIWRDQGWGNRNGKIFIEAEEKSHIPSTSSRRFGEGRVVHTSGIAPHTAKRLGIVFQPKESETYHFWYAAGGGGGHNAHLCNVRIQTLVLDDPGRCFGKAYNVLAKTDALGVWDQKSRPIVHLDVEKFLMTLEERLLPPLISFTNVGHQPETHLEPKIRAFVKSLWESWIEEYLVYANILDRAPSQLRFGLHEGHTVQVDDFLEDRMDFGEFVVPEE